MRENLRKTHMKPITMQTPKLDLQHLNSCAQNWDSHRQVQNKLKEAMTGKERRVRATNNSAKEEKKQEVIFLK